MIYILFTLGGGEGFSHLNKQCWSSIGPMIAINKGDLQINTPIKDPY